MIESRLDFTSGRQPIVAKLQIDFTVAEAFQSTTLMAPSTTPAVIDYVVDGGEGQTSSLQIGEFTCAQSCTLPLQYSIVIQPNVNIDFIHFDIGTRTVDWSEARDEHAGNYTIIIVAAVNEADSGDYSTTKFELRVKVADACAVSTDKIFIVSPQTPDQYYELGS